MQNFRSVRKTSLVTCIVAKIVLFRKRTGREKFIPYGQRLNGSTYLLHVKCSIILWSSEFSPLTFQRNSMKCFSIPPHPTSPRYIGKLCHNWEIHSMNFHHSQGLWDSCVLIFIVNKIFICSCLYNIGLFAGGITVLYLLYNLPCVLETTLKQLRTFSLPSLLDILRNGV